MSDNGTAFTGVVFQFFAKANGFQHVRRAPYHAATNGLVEHAVQILNNALNRMTGDVETCLARFLFQYKLNPHSTMGNHQQAQVRFGFCVSIIEESITAGKMMIMIRRQVTVHLWWKKGGTPTKHEIEAVKGT